MKRQLLIDTLLFEVSKEQINESLNKNDGKLIVQGILQRAEIKNMNGRIYPKDILIREVKKYEESFINEKRALGELDHPDSSVVSLKNVSHNILETWWDKDNLMGRIEILSTPAGNILKELFKADVKLGISSRGLGSLKKTKVNEKEADEVQNDFELISWDFVSTPSTPGAYMHTINEGLNREEVEETNKINKLITEILSSFKITCNSKECKKI